MEVIGSFVELVVQGVGGFGLLVVLLLIEEDFIFDEGLLVDLLIVFDFLFYLIEQVGVYYSFIPGSISFFLETVDLGNLFVVFM